MSDSFLLNLTICGSVCLLILVVAKVVLFNRNKADIEEPHHLFYYSNMEIVMAKYTEKKWMKAQNILTVALVITSILYASWLYLFY